MDLHADEWFADGAQTFDQVGRVEGHGDVIAVHVDINDLLGLRLIGGACGQRQLLSGEGHANRGIAFGDQGDALDGTDQGLLVDNRVNRVFVGI